MSEGSREIEAARRRLDAAKVQASSANQMAQSAKSTLESLQKSIKSAKKNLELAKTQVVNTQKEVEAVEKYMAESEKRWEVINVDADDDKTTPIPKNPGSYKAGIIAAIYTLKDRDGSSSIAIKKHMQARLPKDKKWMNAMYLKALNKAVADGVLSKNKGCFKLTVAIEADETKKRRQRQRLLAVAS